jgi:RNA polymerase sigma-70 factor (ECF subfamily)
LDCRGAFAERVETGNLPEPLAVAEAAMTDRDSRGHILSMGSDGAPERCDVASPTLAYPGFPLQVERAPSSPELCSSDSIPPAPLSSRDSTGRVARFRVMYEAHVDFVWRNLRRLGVAASEVDDKTQEVFVIAHRRFAEFEDRGHGPRAWLFQMVLRVASEARRHRRRHPVDPDGGVAQERISVEPAQAAALDRREALGRLDRALSRIDVGRRVVLVLHEIEEMTAPEIAESLGIPLNTVYSRLRVARGELEAALAEESVRARSTKAASAGVRGSREGER